LAFVLVRVALDMSDRVAYEIAKLKGIQEVYELTGEVDIIAKAEAPDLEELSKILCNIRNIEGVQGTDTRIVLAKVPEKFVGMSKVGEKSQAHRGEIERP